MTVRKTPEAAEKLDFQTITLDQPDKLGEYIKKFNLI